MAGNFEDIWDDGDESLRDELISQTLIGLMKNKVKRMKIEVMQITHEIQILTEKIKDNTEKIELNKILHLVSKINEVLSNIMEEFDVDPQEEENDGAVLVSDNQRKGKCAVIKTSTDEARSTDDFNGAQCTAVCVQARMIALRRSARDSMIEVRRYANSALDAMKELEAKREANLNYSA